MLAHTWAIVPAARLSSTGEAGGRSLPLGEAAGLGLVLDLFQRAGVAETLVVVDGQDQGMCPRVLAGGGKPVVTNNLERDPFSLTRAGVAALPPECRSFFVLPADLPLVRLSTLAALARALAAEEHLAAVPTHAGRRGHPPLLSGALADNLMAWKREGGLRAFLEDLGARLSLVSVRDPGIHQNLDSPEHCRAALRLWAARRGGH